MDFLSNTFRGHGPIGANEMKKNAASALAVHLAIYVRCKENSANPQYFAIVAERCRYYAAVVLAGRNYC